MAGLSDVCTTLCEQLTLGDTCRLMRVSKDIRTRLETDRGVWAYYASSMGLETATRAGKPRLYHQIATHIRTSAVFTRCVECGVATGARKMVVKVNGAPRTIKVCPDCQCAARGYRRVGTRREIENYLVGPAGWTPRKRKLIALYQKIVPCKSRGIGKPFKYWRHQVVAAIAGMYRAA